MKCHLQFTSIAAACGICSTPGLHRLTQGAAAAEGVLGRGGHAQKHQNITAPSPELEGCACRGCCGQARWLSLPPQSGSAETWQRNAPFLWGLAPEIYPDFLFPLITYLYKSYFSWAASRVQLPSRPLQGSVMQLRPSFPSSTLYLPPSPPPPLPNF